MAKKVLILKGDSYKAVGEIFAARGYDVTYDVATLPVVNLVVFTGGSDVSPYIYGEEPCGAVGCDPVRDEFEKSVYEAHVGRVPMIGICRGGQLLNVLNGGKMIQHLGETISGDVEDDVGRIMRVDHHQGMVADIYTSNLLSFYREIEDDDLWPDYAIWYPETKSLCFQPHPEWGHKGTEDYFFELVSEYIGD